ncbi:hypothetical protein LP416_02085 [Polaromonas sp. P2-4]|nr:hypothetical protein LP416_02085 [Polaromonas sp. P2-4]
MSEPLDQLLADLSVIDRFLEVEAFVGKFSTRAIPSNFEILCSGGLDDHDFSELISQGHATSKAARSGLPVVTGTLVLYLAGRFESFIREKIEAAARDIGTKCGKFDCLPKEMRTSLLNLTAEVIKNPRKYGHAENGALAFIKRLAAGYTEITEQDPVNFECISVTEANMKPDVIKEICERIGFADVWGQLAAQSNMKMFFSNMDAGAVSKEAQLKLKKMMEDRNSIAHPASSTTFPTTTAISEYVAFVRMLCAVFELVLDTYVAVVRPADAGKV